MNQFQKKISDSARATTLVELLVSVALTLSVMVLLAMIVSSVSNQWIRGSSRFVLNAEGGVALDYLVQDLSSIVRKGDGSQWLHMKRASAGPVDENFQMLFLAQPLDGQGKVVTLGYRLAFHDPMGGDEPRPVLYRCVFTPEDTIAHLGAEDLQAAWQSRLDEVVDDDWFLAGNVIEVNLKFHFKDVDGKRVTVECLNEASGGKKFEVDGSVVTVAGMTLESATVSLMLLDEIGLRVLQQGSMPRQEMIARHGHEYIEEVKFPRTTGETKYDI